MNFRQLPNIITIIRVLLVIPFAYCVIFSEYRTAFYLYFIASASDGLDGFLARHFNWTSQFGAFMDPLADKFLMITSYTLMAWFDLIPLWLFATVVLRDVIILSGVGGVMYIHGHVNFEPFKISKVNTAFQLLLIQMILFELSFFPVPEGWLFVVMVVITVLTIMSVLAYIWEGTMTALGYRDKK